MILPSEPMCAPTNDTTASFTTQDGDRLGECRLLYIASAGIDDPLIVSQVLRYLQPLASRLGCVHLLTLERERRSEAGRDAIRNRLRADSIHWHPVPVLTRYRAAAIWWDIRSGFRVARRLVREQNIHIVHARSFVPGNIGWQLKRESGACLLYDMRGFWALEKRAKGTIRWQWMQQVAQRMENRLLFGADYLVSLTKAGQAWLRKRGVTAPIHVIPTCVDTKLFTPGACQAEPKRLISVGSLGPGYSPERVFRFYASARKRWPSLELELLTATPQCQYEAAATASGVQVSDVRIHCVPSDKVAERIRESDAGLCFIEPSEAKIASCPTKLAEYLACGLPVVANHRIGDVAEIVRENGVGVVLEDASPDGVEKAVAEFAGLWNDDRLSERCRRAATDHFSLQRGVDAYARIYRDALDRSVERKTRSVRHIRTGRVSPASDASSTQ